MAYKCQAHIHFEEFQVAVSIKPGEQHTPNRVALPNRTKLLGGCAGLLTADEFTRTVPLVHYTVQEYLVSHSLLPKDMDLQLAIACTTYTSSDAFAQGACTSNLDYQSRVQTYPLPGIRSPLPIPPP